MAKRKRNLLKSVYCRFYDVDRGQITWDGQNITKFNIKQYRQAISLVAQESNLIQGTIRENILIGVGDTEITNEQLYEVCRDAGIHDFIVALPNGNVFSSLLTYP